MKLERLTDVASRMVAHVEFRAARRSGAMVTGKQIREARALLGWHRTRLALSAKLPHSTIERAELTDGESLITIANAKAIRQALETAGVEFTDGEPPGVRLKA